MNGKLLAQSTDLGKSIFGTGLGIFGAAEIQEGRGGAVTGLTRLTAIISAIIGVMTVAAGIWFFFNFIVGGIQWISSGGDKHGLEQAQQRITNAFIGLVIVVAGWTILSLAGRFLGFDFLINDPGKVIDSLFAG